MPGTGCWAMSVTGGLRVRGTAAATLYPALVAVELTLLSRVAYRDQEVTGPRLRGLLALLAGDLRTGCSTARLVEGLWPDEQSENPTKALQVLVPAPERSWAPMSSPPPRPATAWP
jgi:hypothetical protein